KMDPPSFQEDGLPVVQAPALVILQTSEMWKDHSDSAPLALPELTSAPTWTVFRNVPPMLYSLDGISTIASAIGDPLHTENSRLDSVNIEITKVKVEIMLDSSPPSAVIVCDTQDNTARCLNCNKFGHLLNRCPIPLTKKAPPRKSAPKKAASPVVPPVVPIELSSEVSMVTQPEDPLLDPQSVSKKTAARARSISRAKSRSRALSTPLITSEITAATSTHSQDLPDTVCSPKTPIEGVKKSYSE
ncbi:hypothetical protein EUTSA_v10027297mg, partial [Eutrema salsugineum]